MPPKEDTTLLGAPAEAPPVGMVGKAKAYVKSSGEVLFAVVFFMACSAGMLLANKAVMKRFDLPITVTIIQLLFCVVALLCYPPALRVGSWSDAGKWAIQVPWLFAVMLASSMIALESSSTGAVVVMRNVAPIISIGVEAMLKEKVRVDVWTILALLYTLGGVTLYMVNDVHFSLIGFLMILINMISAIAERIIERRLLAVDPVDCSKMALLIINNIVAVPFVAILLWPTHEVEDWDRMRYDEDGAPQTVAAYILLVISCLTGVAIGWAGINAQYYLTATSFLVVGNVNKFLVIGFGMLVWGEASSWQAIVGCILAITGGVFYARARHNLEQKYKKAEAAKTAPEEEKK